MHFFARFPFKLSSSLFTDEQRAYPSRITAQRRHRRRRAVGTRCEDSFQIKTLRKPFLLSLVAILSWIFIITRVETSVLACGHARIFARTWTPGAFLPRALFRPVLIKTEYLRECSASRVWPYMHQLRIMSLVKCWVCPAPVLCCPTFRIIG